MFLCGFRCLAIFNKLIVLNTEWRLGDLTKSRQTASHTCGLREVFVLIWSHPVPPDNSTINQFEPGISFLLGGHSAGLHWSTKSASKHSNYAIFQASTPLSIFLQSTPFAGADTKYLRLPRKKHNDNNTYHARVHACKHANLGVKNISMGLVARV